MLETEAVTDSIVTEATVTKARVKEVPETEVPEEIWQPDFSGARVHIFLQPENKAISLPRPKTVRQLLLALKLQEETALVARDGTLLTPDRQIWADDRILVRKILSLG